MLLTLGVQPSELLNQSWNKDKLKYRAPNVIESLSRLNRLSFWVPSVILWQERMKERSKAYKKFVAIAEHLRRMNNYHTLMGIVAGLNMSSINRLKHTLNDVGPAVQNVRTLPISSRSKLTIQICSNSRSW